MKMKKNWTERGAGDARPLDPPLTSPQIDIFMGLVAPQFRNGTPRTIFSWRARINKQNSFAS